MQSFVCFVFMAVMVAVASSASFGYLEEGVPKNVLESLVEVSNMEASPELARWKKSAYGGNSVPAPPCPKSYLFSCQSSVAPVPCAPAPAPVYKPAPAPAYAPAPAPAYAPAPAHAPAPSYAPAPAPAKPSYAGAYSMPVPRYSFPLGAHPGIPQELLMPVYGYNQYLN